MMRNIFVFIRVHSRFFGLFPQTALEDFVDLLTRPGENTGDGSFSPDHLVFKNHPMRAHPHAVETLQIIHEGFYVAA